MAGKALRSDIDQLGEAAGNSDGRTFHIEKSSGCAGEGRLRANRPESREGGRPFEYTPQAQLLQEMKIKEGDILALPYKQPPIACIYSWMCFNTANKA
jgi:hypothetical protein